MRPQILLPFLLSCSAGAQLQVTVPAIPLCKEGSLPILGIALETVMGGDYGLTFPDHLQDALQRQGFRVTADYDWKVADKASIGIRGKVNHWYNISGNQSSRVGIVSLEIYDLSTAKTLYNLDQKPAKIVFEAPREEDFVRQITQFIVDHFCQQ